MATPLKDCTIVLSEDSHPAEGEPWIIVYLAKTGDSTWQVRLEVRCDQKLEEIAPAVISQPSCLRGNMELRLEGKWTKEEIDTGAELVLSHAADLLITTAKKAVSAGVADLLR